MLVLKSFAASLKRRSALDYIWYLIILGLILGGRFPSYPKVETTIFASWLTLCVVYIGICLYRIFSKL